MSTAALPAVAAAPERARRPRSGALSVLARVAWADVLERTRRPGFLVSLLVMMWLAHGMLPPQGAGYRTFVINEAFRPAYGSAWVGTLVALLSSLYFCMVGFYLVKGSVEHDRRTGVGQILAAARVGRVEYVAAKALSHLLVFGAMMLVAAAVALVTQLLLGEDGRVDVLALLWPFLWIALPVAAFVSGCAVLWECTPGLRGGFGNIVWFFFFTFLMSFSAIDDGSRTPFADFSGGRVIASSIKPDLYAAYPVAARSERGLSMGVNVNSKWRGQHMRTFAWHGLHGTAEHLLSRLFWFAIGLGITLLAAVPFDRFESASRPGWLPRWRLRWPARAERVHAGAAATGIAHAGQLSAARRTFRFDAMLRAELALLLRGQPAWWWAGFAGLWIAQLFSPLAVVRTALMPIASIWPVLMWSALGHRERRHGTAGVLFSSARPRERLLGAAFTAAALLFVAAGATGLVRLAAAGDVGAVAGWFAGALCTAGLALALGEWTNHARFFEVLFLFAWYAGPMHRIGELDFTGVTTPRAPLITLVYALIGVGGLLAAWFGRARPTER